MMNFLLILHFSTETRSKDLDVTIQIKSVVLPFIHFVQSLKSQLRRYFRWK